MLIINRKTILFEMYVIIMFFCQFRLVRRQGYILLPVEICIICLYFFWNKCELRIPSVPILLYLFFIIYRIIVSLIMSESGMGNIKSILYRELGMLIMCWFFAEGHSKTDIIKKIRNFGLIMAILGCYEYATHSAVFMRFITTESKMYMQINLRTAVVRVRSIFLHPTICGVFMTILWMCVLFVPYKRKWVNRMAQTVIFLCLLATQSRSNWIAFMVINSLYLWKKYRKSRICLKRGQIIYIGICLVSILTLGFVFREYIVNIYQLVVNRLISAIDSNHAGNYNRVTMIKMGIDEWKSFGILEKVFGAGSGYAVAFLHKHPIRGWNTAVDNQYLTILLDFGLVGLLFLLGLLGYLVKRIITDCNKINCLCGLCLLSMFISAFFYEMFSWIMITIIFALFLCLMDKPVLRTNIER